MKFPGRARLIKIVALCAAGALAGSIVAVAVGSGKLGWNSVDRTATFVVPSFETADAGDARIEFPNNLAKSNGAVSDLLVDDEGNVWLAFVSLQGELVLSRAYDGTAQPQQSLLSGAGTTTLAARLGKDDRGNVIVGTGDTIFVVDPKTGENRTIALPKSDNSGEQPIGIVSLRVAGESAFLLRSQDLIEVLLDTGETRSIAVPSQLGGVNDVVVDANYIWLLNTFDTEGGPSARVGSINRETDAFQAFPVRMHSADIYEGGLIALTWLPDGVATLSPSGSLKPRELGEQGKSFLSQTGPASVVFTQSSTSIWIAAVPANAILPLDPVTSRYEVYDLPLFKVPASAVRCPRSEDGTPLCPDRLTAYTRVARFAVAPNGDTYFLDTNTNRVGLIRASQQ